MKAIRKQRRLQPGTPCLVRSRLDGGSRHNGKVVIVSHFIAASEECGEGYICTPQLTYLEDDGGLVEITWRRESLVPLSDKDGPDESLRWAGLPAAPLRTKEAH